MDRKSGRGWDAEIINNTQHAYKLALCNIEGPRERDQEKECLNEWLTWQKEKDWMTVEWNWTGRVVLSCAFIIIYLPIVTNILFTDWLIDLTWFDWLKWWWSIEIITPSMCMTMCCVGGGGGSRICCPKWDWASSSSSASTGTGRRRQLIMFDLLECCGGKTKNYKSVWIQCD